MSDPEAQVESKTKSSEESTTSSLSSASSSSSDSATSTSTTSSSSSSESSSSSSTALAESSQEKKKQREDSDKDDDSSERKKEKKKKKRKTKKITEDDDDDSLRKKIKKMKAHNPFVEDEAEVSSDDEGGEDDEEEGDDEDGDLAGFVVNEPEYVSTPVDEQSKKKKKKRKRPEQLAMGDLELLQEAGINVSHVDTDVIDEEDAGPQRKRLRKGVEDDSSASSSSSATTTEKKRELLTLDKKDKQQSENDVVMEEDEKEDQDYIEEKENEQEQMISKKERISEIFGEDIDSFYTQGSNLRYEEPMYEESILEEKVQPKGQTESVDQYETRIWNTDVPERFIQRYGLQKDMSKEDILKDIHDEAEWIFANFMSGKEDPTVEFDAKSESKSSRVEPRRRDQNIVPVIESVLNFMRIEHLEVPFIYLYRKESIKNPFNPSLSFEEAALWKIDEYDALWHTLAPRRKVLLEIFAATMNPETEKNIVRLIKDAKDTYELEEVQDYLKDHAAIVARQRISNSERSSSTSTSSSLTSSSLTTSSTTSTSQSSSVTTPTATDSKSDKRRKTLAIDDDEDGDMDVDDRAESNIKTEKKTSTPNDSHDTEDLTEPETKDQY